MDQCPGRERPRRGGLENRPTRAVEPDFPPRPRGSGCRCFLSTSGQQTRRGCPAAGRGPLGPAGSVSKCHRRVARRFCWTEPQGPTVAPYPEACRARLGCWHCDIRSAEGHTSWSSGISRRACARVPGPCGALCWATRRWPLRASVPSSGDRSSFTDLAVGVQRDGVCEPRTATRP